MAAFLADAALSETTSPRLHHAIPHGLPTSTSTLQLTFTLRQLWDGSLNQITVRDGEFVDQLFLYAPDQTKLIVGPDGDNGWGCGTLPGQTVTHGHYYLILLRGENVLSTLDIGVREFAEGSHDFGGVTRFIVPDRPEDYLLLSTYAGCRMVYDVRLFAIRDAAVKPVTFVMLDETRLDSFMGVAYSLDDRNLESCIKRMEDDKVECHSFGGSQNPGDTDIYEKRSWVE